MNNVLIGIGGGIAAYKVCSLISALAKTGEAVRAILSPQGAKFVTPLTLSTLCRSPVYLEADLWSPSQARPLHIELGEWATTLLIAPLTANTLAELSHGFATSLMGNTVLASSAPVLLAPAMNTTMWQQPVVQENFRRLLEQPRFHSIGPDFGVLACDAVGPGKMVDPQQLFAYLESLGYSGGKRDLSGKHILVTAGGTREYLDPVRFIGNPSTGKMGLSLALAAAHRGATVQLVVGPRVEVPIGLSIQGTTITSAAEMQQALQRLFPQADWLLMAAAVADFKPATYHPTKLPKVAIADRLELEAVPDLLQMLSAQKKPHQKLIGFAAQTGDMVAPAAKKLVQKGLDAIVANPIDQPEAGFGSDRNRAVWMTPQLPPVVIPTQSKLSLAHRILDLALTL
ncbi:bifunctional phosphopantothenoylcysteine decarboxylase/phosphopantothenate--cysteine ligase CoaBC [Lyngbya confervoides]|uniref:Coenzyme A biosynthesis bifunctional protein CoaBC n=1 Tax=Lyngbya confervoides BDU141951 TaxID=1574623 RepID=A0ABD4TAI7_9CYAN|nr:bifunctional phosphopantothenoylcysteine decarboxylase/phosphopantothenate--cysteine ligase CoaBC [Lyngbya confervoides]MCM1985335.1 bifunctional phosphopantothenoylcysteine decarboxylase/phosphopantothenate--cysteine ligase CoaBC [Lyngbya confervoides BDU141951]